MILTLELSPQEEARLREKAARQGQEATAYAVAVLRHDMELSAPERVSQGETRADFLEAAKRESITPLPQGSPEWKAALHSIGQGHKGVTLSLEATSRVSIYEDDLR